jgi:MYXO-CTERM domain-containing protein
MIARYVFGFILLGSTAASAAPVERRTERIVADPALLRDNHLRADNLESRTIYLNRCRGGCTITRGQESATNNSSAILGVGTAYITEFQHGDAMWDQIVRCVEETYAPFNIKITDERPASGTYWMNIVAGTAQQAGMPQGVLGVSPSTASCPAGFLTNTVTFSFVNDPYAQPADVNEYCWIVAQETAHSFGLDHEALAGDAMTYIGLGQRPGSRHSFLDQSGSCGAYQPGDNGCYCPSIPTQNSYRAIHDIFGGSCADDDSCSELGDGLVCVAGNCVDGPDNEGGLGTDCDGDSSCSSGQCTESSEGSVCTEDCDPSGDDCPAGFSCLEHGSAGVCWPGGGGGCCSTSDEPPTGAIMLGFGLFVLVMRRRRAR